MLIHISRCPYRDKDVVERILDSEGSVCVRKFKIHCLDYGADEDTWESRSNVHPISSETLISRTTSTTTSGATGVTNMTDPVIPIAESRSTSENNMTTAWRLTNNKISRTVSQTNSCEGKMHGKTSRKKDQKYSATCMSYRLDLHVCSTQIFNLIYLSTGSSQYSNTYILLVRMHTVLLCVCVVCVCVVVW